MTDRTRMPRTYRLDSFRHRAEAVMAKAARAEAHGAGPRAEDLRRKAADLIRQGAVEIEDEYLRLRELDQELAFASASAALDARTDFDGKMIAVAA